MNTIAQFLAGFVANILQRAFGTKPNVLLTITGIISAVAAGLADFPTSILPAKYEPWLIAAAGFFGVLAGVLGHGSSSTPISLVPPTTPQPVGPEKPPMGPLQG